MHHFGDIRLLKLPWPWNTDQGHSRSLQMVPFDRLYTTSYWCIVTMALSRNVFEIFNILLTYLLTVTLKFGSGVTQGQRKWHHSIACIYMISYWHPTETLCLKCTLFEISWHIGRKSMKKPTPLLLDAPCPANPRKYPYTPYIVRNCDLWPTFLLLIVWVYLHSYFRGWLWKTDL